MTSTSGADAPIRVNAERVLWRLPSDVHAFLALDLVQAHRGDVWLAGGALRSLIDRDDPVVDFDLFFKTEEARDVTVAKLEALGAECIFKCPEGKLQTFKLNLDGKDYKIQVITPQFYGNADTLLDTFDLHACRFAYDGDKITLFRSSIRAIRDKVATIHRVTHPNATFRRLLKYRDKGYKIPNQAIDMLVETVYDAGMEAKTLSREFYID